MKVVVAGGTGFVGAEVLRQLLAMPSISSIIALARRDLPTSLTEGSPKLRTVIMKDFTHYSPEVIKELEGAEAAIWCIGTVPTSKENPKVVNVEFTTAAAKTFSEELGGPGDGKSFRFVYVSGVLAVADQNAKPWYMAEGRLIRVCA